MTDETAKPKVFISYSHNDEAWKKRVLKHLRVLEAAGELTVWDDELINAGDEWRSEIEVALESAKVAVLLVSTDFLTSPFILSKEIPRLLKRRLTDSLRVIPIFVDPCPWEAVTWLADLQGRPRNGTPLSGLSRYQAEKELAALALEIRKLLEKQQPGQLTASIGDLGNIDNLASWLEKPSTSIIREPDLLEIETIPSLEELGFHEPSRPTLGADDLALPDKAEDRIDALPVDAPSEETGKERGELNGNKSTPVAGAPEVAPVDFQARSGSVTDPMSLGREPEAAPKARTTLRPKSDDTLLTGAPTVRPAQPPIHWPASTPRLPLQQVRTSHFFGLKRLAVVLSLVVVAICWIDINYWLQVREKKKLASTLLADFRKAEDSSLAEEVAEARALPWQLNYLRFSDPGEDMRGWCKLSSDEGVYQLDARAKRGKVVMASMANIYPSSLSGPVVRYMSVEVRQVEGSERAAACLLFRGEYGFCLSQKGYFLGKNFNDWIPLRQGAATAVLRSTPTIPNRLAVIARGGQFIALINGKEVDHIEDLSPQGKEIKPSGSLGNIGMGILLFEKAESAVFDFDHVELR